MGDWDTSPGDPLDDLNRAVEKHWRQSGWRSPPLWAVGEIIRGRMVVRGRRNGNVVAEIIPVQSIKIRGR